jgi:hypothetical protein
MICSKQGTTTWQAKTMRKPLNVLVGLYTFHRFYQKSSDLLISAGKERDTLLSEKVKILSNLSECLIRLSRWREAEKRATEALEIDSVNTKAIWRRGRSRVQLMEVSLFINLNVRYFERRLSRAVVILDTENFGIVVDFVLFFFL